MVPVMRLEMRKISPKMKNLNRGQSMLATPNEHGLACRAQIAMGAYWLSTVTVAALNE
jgi:hypothetical protein